MSQPPKSTILAPRARWLSLRMVFWVMARVREESRPLSPPSGRDWRFGIGGFGAAAYYPARRHAFVGAASAATQSLILIMPVAAEAAPTTDACSMRRCRARTVASKFRIPALLRLHQQRHPIHPDDAHRAAGRQVGAADHPERVVDLGAAAAGLDRLIQRHHPADQLF